MDTNDLRHFKTGATRDTSQGKLDYAKALSFIVLRRYLQYLDKHRTLPDGSLRDFDNWKQGMPVDVYKSSLTRHLVDTIIVSDGYVAKDNHGPCDLEDLLCAIIFNAQGWLHELIKEKERTNE